MKNKYHKIFVEDGFIVLKELFGKELIDTASHSVLSYALDSSFVEIDHGKHFYVIERIKEFCTTHILSFRLYESFWRVRL